MIVSLASCTPMFERGEELMDTYKLNDNTQIQVFNVGYGATTKNHVEIRRNGFLRDDLVKRIDDNPLGMKAKIIHLDGSKFKLTFTDTTLIIGNSRSYPFDIN